MYVQSAIPKMYDNVSDMFCIESILLLHVEVDVVLKKKQTNTSLSAVCHKIINVETI